MKKSVSLIFLNYLRYLARLQLAKISWLQKNRGRDFKIVGITGSAGKTSTLLACEAALTPDFKIKTNYGGNSQSGIPLNILGLKTSGFSFTDWLKIALVAPLKLLTDWNSYDVYLVEMGIDGPDQPDNMSYLLKILRPDIGIFLNVNPVHSQAFDKTVPQSFQGASRLQKILGNIAKEKARLILSLPSSGTAILNPDDPYVMKSSLKTRANILLIHPQDTQSINLRDHVFPEVFRQSLSAALFTALSLGIPENRAVKNIETHLHFPPSRSTLFKGIDNSLIIDSSYNSSPDAAADMLRLLSTYPSPRLAVLGDMRELGLQSASAHQSLYKQALKSADIIIGVGPETQQYFGPKAHTFQFWWQAADYLKNNFKPHSTILVKGSQNTIFLEELIKNILLDPRDASRLCRQSPYWLKTKKIFYNKNHQSGN
ncbi:MAG TPA: Mur ligase family protein [Patescibacteria group bacterium]